MSDLSSLLAVTIPLSWAAAVSPVTFSIFLVIMSMAKKPKLAGFSFYLGAIVVLLVTVFMGIFLGQKLSSSGLTDPATMTAIDLFLGAVLILLGIRNFAAKGDNKGGNMLKHLQIDENAGTFRQFFKYFIIGIVAFIMNFSTAIFVLGVGRSIGVANSGLSNDTIAVIILILIALLIIEVPLLFFVILPEKAHAVLGPVDKWINNHGNIVTGLFCIFIGIFVIYSGLQKLGI
ncbi:MAG: GAP family protein [Methanobacteriaceae archaeon]|nr:GAP family protein [Methanobacteriaceae archaeon]